MIYSEKMYELGSKRSAIRELFEYGKKQAAMIGAENVFDFSLGNPTVPSPDIVNETLKKNLPITTEFITQEEAVGRFDLKRLPDHASETVRVVHVGDYDECLCIGLHVENTSQIGIFKIISYDYKEGIFRMRFKLTLL